MYLNTIILKKFLSRWKNLRLVWVKYLQIFPQLNLSRTEKIRVRNILKWYVTEAQAHGSGGGSVVGAPDKIFQFQVS